VKCLLIRQLSMISVLLFLGFQARALQCSALFTQESASAFSYLESASAVENLTAFAESRNLTYKPEEKWLNHPIWRIPKQIAGFSNSALMVKDGQASAYLKFRLRDKEGSVSTEDLPVHETKTMFSSPFPGHEFLGEIWKDGDQNFRFMNIGSRQLLHGNNPQDIVDLVLAEAKNHPGMDIQVPLSPEWAVMRSVLNDRQVYASTKGINNYIERKPYLDAEDLYQLRSDDLLHKQENDFLVLLKEFGKNPLEMTPEEFQENLALMVRIARFNPNEHPFLGGFLGGMGVSSSLPFFSRVPPNLQQPIQGFLRLLRNDKDLKVAELSRYNKFHELSEAVQDKFLARMFEMARQPEYPIDIFLLECDRFTSRLFARYGFKKLVRLTPEGGASPEYLMYLDTHSQEYLDVVARLNGNSNQIITRTERTITPFSTWSYNWNSPSSFYEASRFVKRSQMEKILERFRSEIPPTKFFAEEMNFLAASLRYKDEVLVTGEASELVVRILKAYAPTQSIKLLQATEPRPADKIVFARWNQTNLTLTEEQSRLIQASLKTGGKLVPIHFYKPIEKHFPQIAVLKEELKDITH
jgi:hypothetical protein